MATAEHYSARGLQLWYQPYELFQLVRAGSGQSYLKGMTGTGAAYVWIFGRLCQQDDARAQDRPRQEIRRLQSKFLRA
jgi:hypothetical protein